jgi:hypothetical protein
MTFNIILYNVHEKRTYIDSRFESGKVSQPQIVENEQQADHLEAYADFSVALQLIPFVRNQIGSPKREKLCLAFYSDWFVVCITR